GDALPAVIRADRQPVDPAPAPVMGGEHRADQLARPVLDAERDLAPVLKLLLERLRRIAPARLVGQPGSVPECEQPVVVSLSDTADGLRIHAAGPRSAR